MKKVYNIEKGEKRIIYNDTILDLLDVELEDDNTPYGGVSFFGETLRDFMEECHIGYNATLKEVNKALKECGIKTLERK